MVVAELTPEEREELYQDLLADRVRLEDHLQLIPKKVRSRSISVHPSGAFPEWMPFSSRR